jgi:predicted transcriptional regulator
METESLIARLFDDSKAQFLSAFLSEKGGLTPGEAEQLRELIRNWE